MAREPRYPKDAAIGDAQTQGRAESGGQPPRETGAAPAPAAEKDGDGKRTRQIMTGAAIGIGSAAIVAALLYANRRGNRS
jgi:hypothetical protein